MSGDRPSRVYLITPDPPLDERAAIVDALERVAGEDDAPDAWQQHARREVVDDGLA